MARELLDLDAQLGLDRFVLRKAPPVPLWSELYSDFTCGGQEHRVPSGALAVVIGGTDNRRLLVRVWDAGRNWVGWIWR